MSGVVLRDEWNVSVREQQRAQRSSSVVSSCANSVCRQSNVSLNSQSDDAPKIAGGRVRPPVWLGKLPPGERYTSVVSHPVFHFPNTSSVVPKYRYFSMPDMYELCLANHRSAKGLQRVINEPPMLVTGGV